MFYSSTNVHPSTVVDVLDIGRLQFEVCVFVRANVSLVCACGAGQRVCVCVSLCNVSTVRLHAYPGTGSLQVGGAPQASPSNSLDDLFRLVGSCFV